MSRLDKLLDVKSAETELVREVVSKIAKPAERAYIKPFSENRAYRGKRRQVVGYSWSRPASTFHGRVYDCVLGYGDSFDAALKMARAKQSA